MHINIFNSCKINYWLLHLLVAMLTEQLAAPTPFQNQHDKQALLAKVNDNQIT